MHEIYRRRASGRPGALLHAVFAAAACNIMAPVRGGRHKSAVVDRGASEKTTSLDEQRNAKLLNSTTFIGKLR